MVMDQEHEHLEQLLLIIDPTMTKEMLVMHFNLILSPLIIHSDYRGATLLRLEQKAYSREYLDALVTCCIEQSLLRYQLPLEENHFS